MKIYLNSQQNYKLNIENEACFYLSVGTLRGLPLAALDAPVDDHGRGPEARHAPRPRVLVVGGPGPLHHRLPLVSPRSRDQIPAL